MRITHTAIADVKLIHPSVSGDARGFFVETFSLQRYRDALRLPALNFVQDNHSRSQHGVLRGLHFQRQQPQGKLVRCVRGQVFDVAVDIRRDSPTYGRWVGAILNEDNHAQLWIPPGFAHGFAVLGAVADTEYKCTAYYHPQSEVCLRWNDPAIGIDWPLAHPLLSAKDAQGKTLAELAALGKTFFDQSIRAY